MIILFATQTGELYVFTDPMFDTRDKCMEYLVENSPSITEKLRQEYGYDRKILTVNCLREFDFKRIIDTTRRYHDASDTRIVVNTTSPTWNRDIY